MTGWKVGKTQAGPENTKPQKDGPERDESEMEEQSSEHDQQPELSPQGPIPIEDLEAHTVELEELLVLCSKTQTSWSVDGKRLAVLAQNALREMPSAKSDPGYAPLRHRLRIIADEAQILVDRDSVQKSNVEAGDRYVDDLRHTSAQYTSKKDADDPHKMALLTDESRAFFNDAKGKTGGRERIEAERLRLRLTKAEQAGITVFTSQDYKYMNPATANDTKWMVSQLPDGDKTKIAAAKKGKARDKVTAEIINERKKQGALHSAFAVQGMSKMPVWKGWVHRGEVFNKKELLKDFELVDRASSEKTKKKMIVPRKLEIGRSAIASTSVREEVATAFGRDGITDKGGTSGYIVLWRYELTNGRDIRELSTQDEGEIATLPGAKFKITGVGPYRGSFYEGINNVDPDKVFVIRCLQVE